MREGGGSGRRLVYGGKSDDPTGVKIGLHGQVYVLNVGQFKLIITY